jgi:hypothetical protein
MFRLYGLKVPKEEDEGDEIEQLCSSIYPLPNRSEKNHRRHRLLELYPEQSPYPKILVTFAFCSVRSHICRFQDSEAGKHFWGGLLLSLPHPHGPRMSEPILEEALQALRLMYNYMPETLKGQVWRTRNFTSREVGVGGLSSNGILDSLGKNWPTILKVPHACGEQLLTALQREIRLGVQGLERKHHC